jgi:hypothetical protein
MIGLAFGLSASVMTFPIIYDEYRKHSLRGWRLWKEALGAAALALTVFLGLSLVAGYWFGQGVR